MGEPCITYERFPERRWRQPPAPRPLRVPKEHADPRQALADAVAASGDSYAALSRMLGHWPGYLANFVHDGVPRALGERDHKMLSDYLGRPIGIRALWARR